ncbi:unnamed protein product [Litomosoides sigmodontis]|uniref:Uncharacterized protein n=1 Tax=Litomosoides sigmodontis TaxID=42156 RepID=A0A3P6U3H2_LITSI|nr:unnamed protein product [Litomosoides sigmodontis]
MESNFDSKVEISPSGMFLLMPNNLPSQGNRSCQFRPFGVLEPLCAKAARRDIAKALPLICEIASVKYKLKELDKEYNKLKKSLVLVT